MSQRNPASILLDVNGNLVGVMYDGSVYRLQVEALVTNPDGLSADIEVTGTRDALAVSYPEMLTVLERITSQLDTVLRHLAVVTDETDPM